MALLITLPPRYPLDVIKTRAQLGHGNSSFGTIGSSLRTIVQTEGVRNLYRGISAPMSIEPVKRVRCPALLILCPSASNPLCRVAHLTRIWQAVKFTANEFYKGVVPMGHWYSLYAAGALAGMTECIFIAAPETVKVVLISPLPPLRRPQLTGPGCRCACRARRISAST
jgi:hypothetical protein